MTYKIYSFFFSIYVTLTVVACKNYTGVPDPNIDVEVDERVYNGVTSQPGQIPYQALTEAPLGNGYVIRCGGSLISPNFLLTAAHCTYGKRTIYIFLGLINSRTKQGAWSTYASWIYTHPQFNSKTLDNDIAILQLAEQAPINRYIQTIPLPRSSQRVSAFDNYYTVVSGWGNVNNNGNGPDYLQWQRIHVMPHRSCAQQLPNFRIDNSKMCTDKIVHSGPCQGDSGGPLALWLNGKPTLLGIVSFRIGECINRNPEVYTYVGFYLPYISKVTGIPIQ